MSFSFLSNIEDHQATIDGLKPMAEHIHLLAKQLADRVAQGGTIYWLGNGGSAADAQHLAAELVGRFKLERPAIASVALHTDTSILTCLSNDYDYSIVFARQLEAMCRPADVVIGLSTSGNSENILRAMAVAKSRGALTLGLTGANGQKLNQACDHCVLVPSTDTARIQEAHILIGHSLCQYIELQVAKVAVETVV
ncbi:MAG: SIS domain-containing protein [Coxiellaceae bacterium]|nr:SIS domain-containing protein [Coxiellaceae bacterium]